MLKLPEHHGSCWRSTVNINANRFPRLFGFLLGVTLAGATAYYYVVDEYKLGNAMLNEDIYVSLSSPVPEHDSVPEGIRRSETAIAP